jgi:isocitrate/isopropylmalate dehydrogenase
MGMLLEYTGHAKAGARIERAISDTLAAGRIPDLSAGKCPPTSEIGDMIAKAVA